MIAKTSSSQSSKATQLFERLVCARGHDARSPLRARLRLMADDALPALVAGLRHSGAFARWEAISLLGDLANPKALTPMLNFALHEEETHARWRSFWAVSRLPRNLTKPRLHRATTRKCWRTRWHAALMLSMMHDSVAVPVIAEAFERQGETAAARFEAISAAKALGDASLAPAVIAYLNPDQARFLRQEAALALGHLRHRATRKALERAAQDSHPGVRWRADVALKRIVPLVPKRDST